MAPVTIASLLTTRGGPRRASLSCLGALLLSTAALAIDRQLFDGVGTFPADMHASASTDLAANHSYCGTTGLISADFVLSRHLREHPEAMREPVAAILDRTATKDGYCRTVTVPYAHNENGLMLFETAFLTIRPRASARQIGLALAAVSAMVAAIVAYASLRAGLAWWLSATIVWFFIAVAGRLSMYQFTAYPLDTTTAILFVGAVTVAAASLRGRAAAACATAGALLGLVAGFGMNVRTSHSLVYIVLAVELAAFVYAARVRLDQPGVAILPAASLLVAFAAAVALFDVVFIRPVRVAAARATNNYVFHTVAHPLVMGLAVPPSDLSRREGLEWNDSIGLAVARRVDPTVTFLGPTYEGALFTYYFGLWRQHPAEMRTVYWRKLLAAGRGVFLQAAQLVPGSLRRIYLVFADRANGLELLAGSFGAALVAFWRAIRTGSAPAFGVAAAATVTSMIVAEAAIIFPTFFLAYHAWLLLAVVVGPAIALQIVIDTAASAWPMRLRS